jgi:hypothetical protein
MRLPYYDLARDNQSLCQSSTHLTIPLSFANDALCRNRGRRRKQLWSLRARPSGMCRSSGEALRQQPDAVRELRAASWVELTATCRLTRSLPFPVLTSTSVPNPHAEAAAVIAVIVIVDGEYQTTIGGDGSV